MSISEQVRQVCRASGSRRVWLRPDLFEAMVYELQPAERYTDRRWAGPSLSLLLSHDVSAEGDWVLVRPKAAA